MYDESKDPGYHNSYGHPILDDSKIFSWTKTSCNHKRFPDYFCYVNRTERVAVWVDKGNPMTVYIEGAKCLGRLYSLLEPDEKKLFLNEINLIQQIGEVHAG